MRTEEHGVVYARRATKLEKDITILMVKDHCNEIDL
jgi:hypothetical protein